MDEQLRIAYCEDESIQLEKMEQLLKKWTLQNKCSAMFQGYESGEAFFFENQESYPFDLIFIDIEMKTLNGMTVARRVRETDQDIELVFLTNRKEFVFEGYEVKALRYCVKPMDENKLNEILLEILSKKVDKKCYFVEKQDGELRKVDLSQVLYVEANGHYIHIHTKDNHYMFKKSLQEIIDFLAKKKESMEKAGFMLTHRSYLVNLEFVEQVQKTECILETGVQIPISRNSYKKVNDEFINYYKNSRKNK